MELKVINYPINLKTSGLTVEVEDSKMSFEEFMKQYGQKNVDKVFIYGYGINLNTNKNEHFAGFFTFKHKHQQFTGTKIVEGVKLVLN